MSHRSECGFTMVEILASVAILSIVIVPLMGLMASAPLIHTKQERQTRAAFLVQLKLEEVKNKITYDNNLNFTTEYDEEAVAFTIAQDTKFKYTITITDPDPDPGDLKTITVQVWYDENDTGNTPDTGEQSSKLETNVAKRK